MSEKLKILAPVNSFTGAKYLAKSGANEFYIGLDFEAFKSFNFTSRAKYSHAKVKSCVTANELRDIVAFAHDNDITVNYVANTRLMLNDDDESGEFEKFFLEYLHTGITCGVDAVIVGSVSHLFLLQQHPIDIPIHTSTLINTFNTSQIEFLKQYNVTRVIFPYHISYEDLRDIVSKLDFEYEIFGHFSCSNINGLCYLIHNAGEECNFQVICRNRYDVYQNGQQLAEAVDFMDSGLDCSICSLPLLKDLNTGLVIKIVGRDRPPDLIVPVVRMYRTCIDMVYNGATRAELKKAVASNPIWQDYYCANQRCKYVQTAHTQYYI